MIAMRASLLLAMLGLAACGGELEPVDATSPSTAIEPLVTHDRWREVDAAHDPFLDRPEDADCGPGGFALEGEVLEVDTQRCGYFTAVQDTLRAAEVGDVIRVAMWHLDLYAPEPAQGHVAVAIGDTVVLDFYIDIPHAGEAYEVTHVVTSPIPAGTEAFVHVHNHGYNDWRVGPVDLVVTE